MPSGRSAPGCCSVPPARRPGRCWPAWPARRSRQRLCFVRRLAAALIGPAPPPRLEYIQATPARPLRPAAHGHASPRLAPDCPRRCRADRADTLADQAYRRLHRALMTGGLLPEQVLTVRGVADQYGVSLTPGARGDPAAGRRGRADDRERPHDPRAAPGRGNLPRDPEDPARARAHGRARRRVAHGQRRDGPARRSSSPRTVRRSRPARPTRP